MLFFNRELRIADHYLRPLLNHMSIFNSHGESQMHSLTEMKCSSRRSIFNSHGVVADQVLTAMGQRSELKSNYNPRIVILVQ